MKPIDDIEEQEKNEETTKLNYITPALKKKWCNEGDRIVMEYSRNDFGLDVSGYYFTDGRIKVKEDGSVERGKKNKVDYLLLCKGNYPLALVEAKGYDHDINDGVSQALKYARLLDVPFAYTSNGKLFHEEDIKMGTNREFALEDFPTSDELWNRYVKNENLTQEQQKIILSPYYTLGNRKPRYYQRIAVNRVIKAIAEGKNRELLVMATGTGKTFVAMQIIYRLHKMGLKKKILFLVDRNALADQTMTDFVAFNQSSMVKIGEKYSLKRQEDVKMLSAYEIFISLYTQLKGGKSDDEESELYFESDDTKNYYKNLPPDFFDLIVVDECHRGSLNEEKSWHEILEYFGSATQIGLTATPKETSFGSNITYFGDPIFTYSLQQGIEDGFLAPYTVIAYELDVDRDGYQPKHGEKDIYGKPLEDRLYTAKEFDRKLIIDDRRELVAQKITEYLKETDRYAKTIVFCETEEHAGGMVNALKNLNSDLVAEDSRYIMRITANDQEGKDQIKNFSSKSQKYPVIAVTSKLLSTGVDTKTVELIVLDKSIGSMTEFKQTIGRGTRIEERYEVDGKEKSKTHFTIMDFRGNYRNFDDPDFDGTVEVIDGNSAPLPKKGETKTKTERFRIKGVEVEVAGKIVRFLNDDLTTNKEQTIEDFAKNNINEAYKTYDEFRSAWFNSTNKTQFINEILVDQKIIQFLKKQIGENADWYDLIAYYGYGIEIPDKKERIEKCRQFIGTLNEEQQKIVTILLKCYLDTDFYDLKTVAIFEVDAFRSNHYTKKSAVMAIGGKEEYKRIINKIEEIMFKE